MTFPLFFCPIKYQIFIFISQNKKAQITISNTSLVFQNI